MTINPVSDYKQNPTFSQIHHEQIIKSGKTMFTNSILEGYYTSIDQYEREFEMIKYPFYKINSNTYLFGSVHSNNPNTICQEIFDILVTCDTITLECDTELFNRFDNGKIVKAILKNDTLANNVINFFDAENFCENYNEKNSTFDYSFCYYTSAGFVYDSNLLDRIANTTLFKGNIANGNGIDIKNISFSKIASVYLMSLLYFGNDIFFANYFKYMNKKCFYLDEKTPSFAVKTYMGLLLIAFLFLIVCIVIFSGKIDDTFNLSMRINNFTFNKIMSTFKNNKMVYKHLVVERNNKWLPKIRKLINENDGTTKSLIMVGAGHIDDLVEKLKDSYNIEQFVYPTYYTKSSFVKV